MIEVLSSPAHLVALKVTGRLEASDIEAAVVAMEGALSELRKISLFFDLSEMEELTFEAVKKDMSYAYQMLSHLGRYHRGAVVTDREWIAVATRVEDFLLPGLDVRSFSPDQRDAAFAWASEEPPEQGDAEVVEKADPAPASMKLLETDNKDVIALEVVGRITKTDLPMAEQLLDDLIEREDQVNLLVKASDYDGFDWDMMLQHAMLEKKFKAMAKIRNYALIDAPDWMGNLVRFTNPVTPMECRTFTADQEADAWRWVEAKPL